MSDVKDLSLYDLMTGEFVEREKFEVTDVNSAVWCLGKIHEANANIAAAQAKYAELRKVALEKLDAWLESVTKKDEETITRMEVFLRPYAEKECTEKKTKHVDVPGGRIGFRQSPPSVSIDDEELVLNQLKILEPSAVNVKESVDKKALRKLIESGTHIEGASVQDGEIRMYVEER